MTGDMFLKCTFCVNETVDGGCKCSMHIEAKPLWIDDLLWDCLCMEGNKKEPLSLRATGAFTVSGVEIHEAVRFPQRMDAGRAGEIRG